MIPSILPCASIERAAGSLLRHLTGRPLCVWPSSPTAFEVACAVSPTKIPAGAVTSTDTIFGAPAIAAIALQPTAQRHVARTAARYERDILLPHSMWVSV